MRYTLPTTLLLSLLATSAVATEHDYWQIQTSVYTRHYHPEPDHNNHQRLIGLERGYASGNLWGGAVFRNSFDQSSQYAYVGRRFDSNRHPFYAKLTGGLLHGYRGEYRDKIPLNHLGVAPAIIPSLGVQSHGMAAELVLLGNAALMVNLGLRL